MGKPTGRSHWFDAGVYAVIAVVCVVLGALTAIWWAGLLVGAVFLVLAVRAAWASDAPKGADRTT